MGTQKLGLNTPIIGSNAWGNPTNFNWALLDRYLSGSLPLPGMLVSGDVYVAGTITAGAFAGLDGTFLTSRLLNQANGVPQLNAGGIIPASLLPTQGVVPVAYSATPVFNAGSGQGFLMTLTGDVTSSIFANGATGPSLVTFRIVQDSIGGHAFNWPSNVRNAGLINQGAGARSLQSFAVDTDGSLDAASPMMYS
jgi:hypothetical protein